MKVIVIGATGSIGKLAVQILLEDGQGVTAFARHPENLDLRNKALTRVAGDATDGQSVAQAIKGHDAVIVTLGAGAKRTGTIRSTGTLNVILGMQKHGVKRLICQSTLGAHDSWGNLNFFWKRIMFGLLLRPVHRDHELQETLVRASGLDWTIVRPSAFSDQIEAGALREGFAPDERGLKLQIARLDVARFLGRQLRETRYLRHAVAISY
jgi:uncharacterized protein YbjT (DUF2867 family)